MMTATMMTDTHSLTIDDLAVWLEVLLILVSSFVCGIVWKTQQ
jgi:hypothetical protein